MTKLQNVSECPIYLDRRLTKINCSSIIIKFGFRALNLVVKKQ